MQNHKARLLIVDDETGFTKLIKVVLPAYEICEENNPAKALETARKFRPDLIFLDVIMPEIDGGEVAAQFKADPMLKRVPIIFLTAIVSKKETDNHQMFGGFPFLAKPVTMEKLAECIEEHLVFS
jgi:two-component system OmpR family response regulator